MRAVALALIVAFALPVAAAPDAGAARKPSKEELKQYRAAMSEAKKLARKGNHAAALAAYDRVLAIAPEDPAALTDQGWSAFLLHDLARAEAITRRAIATKRWQVAAAAHYNLGRILEERKDKAGAVAAYLHSLFVRPNRVVRQQLEKLDPAAAAAADPLKPEPMAGPFANLSDFCKTLSDEEQRESCPAPGRGSVLTKVGAPYDAVTWFQAGDRTADCFLALRLPKKGWFVERNGLLCHDTDFLEQTVVSFEVKDLVPGGNREVVARVNNEVSERDAADPDDASLGSTLMVKRCEGFLTACGVRSPGGEPSCLRFQYAKGESCAEDGSGPWQWQLEPVFSDGQVDLKPTGKLDADARALMGRRPLAFP
jgi:hypothetical protein